jgi:hypothetical protein
MAPKRIITEDGETVVVDVARMNRAANIHVTVSIVQLAALACAVWWVSAREMEWKWFRRAVWTRPDMADWVHATEKLNRAAGWEGADVARAP